MNPLRRQLPRYPPKTKPPAKTEYTLADLSKTSLQWVPHWRKTIGKLQHLFDTAKQRHVIRAWPHNPEWTKAMSLDSALNLLESMPQPFLDPVDFDTVDELDEWARVIARLDN